MTVVVEKRRTLAVSVVKDQLPDAVPLEAPCTEAMTTYKR
jgi:hypothetical protein